MVTAWNENIFLHTDDYSWKENAESMHSSRQPCFILSDETEDVTIRKRNVSRLNYTLNHIYQYESTTQ